MNTYSNNHTVNATTPGTLERRAYATAIFTRVVTLLNHSCATNTGVVVQKDVQITVATKRIQIGEEVCHIYQGHFADTPIDKRKELMQKYFHFTCKCKACEENWPTFDKLEEDFENEEYKELTTQLQIAFEDADYQKALAVMQKKLSLICDHLQEPHKLYVRERAAYLECLSQCYGNLHYQPLNRLLNGK